MPIHLNYQGTICKKCGAEFIAYKKECLCPKCAHPTDEFFEFAAATIESMKDHKQLYGNYFPDAWFSGSTADLVQGMIFELFDNFEAQRPDDFGIFVLGQLDEAEWDEGGQHLAEQAKEIALEVYKIYLRDNDFRGDNLKEKPLDPKLKSLKSEEPEFDNLWQNL